MNHGLQRGSGEPRPSPIFTDIREMSNEVAPSGRPYDSPAHAGLSLLPGTHAGKPGALDFSPIVVFHFRSFSARLGLLDESIHPLLPLPIYGNGPSIVDPEAQKELGRFFKELFAAGELPALHGLINPFLEVGWQGNVYHADLHTVSYAKGRDFSSSDFTGSFPQTIFSVPATKGDPRQALRYE